MKRRDAWPATCTLWIGDTYAPHLAATAELLAGATTWHVAEDVDAAIVLLETADVVPTLIVVAERYVGHVAHAQLDRLAGLAPLAGFVALTSIWSEGSGRSGNPWPAARMIGWARAEAYIQEQLRRIAAGCAPDWALPPTATADERHLLAGAAGCDHAKLAETTPHRGATIVVQSSDREMQGWLAAGLGAEGFVSVARPLDCRAPVQGAAATVVDWPDFRRSDTRRVTELVAAVAPVGLLLVSFPRPEMLGWLHDTMLDDATPEGTTAVALLPRPVDVAELAGTLCRLITPRCWVGTARRTAALTG
ncbi:MAG: hypothetical protein KDA63_10175 [Planctomycetales bacterium]|nr:hypothetical protein [Planctomycetales bacterium]